MNLNNKNEFKNSIKKRNYVYLVCSFIIFIFLIIRLAYLQLGQGDNLAVWADEQYCYEEYTDNLTFKLLDNTGENLFNYIMKFYVVVDPITFYTLNDEDTFIDMRKVLYILRDYDKEYDISELQSEMDKGSKKYEVDEETYNKIKELNKVKGIYAYKYKDYDKEQTNWNIKNLLAIPIKNTENTPMKDEGTLEMKIYGYVKDNYKDKIRFEKDVSENITSESEVVEPTNKNIKTTLNKKMQEKVEAVLRSEEYKNYDQIGVVLMESSTGRILSMAQKNDWLSNPNIGINNNNGYLVGSIFKTIVYEAALEKGVVDENEILDITSEELKDVFSENKETENYNIKEAYTVSSNKSFFLIGKRVGVDNMYRLANLQGLFNTVLGLQDEAIGRIEHYGEVPNESLITNTSIGQTVRSTPLGALAIANTTVNEGVYVKPRILDSVVQNDGKVVEEFDTTTNRVISEHTAAVVKDGMISVVNLGTGTNAKINGVEIGGKTGSTEYGPKNELTDVWFSGFFKIQEKYYTMVVFIPHSDKVEKMSSSIACSVFKEIVEEVIENKLIQ